MPNEKEEERQPEINTFTAKDEAIKEAEKANKEAAKAEEAKGETETKGEVEESTEEPGETKANEEPLTGTEAPKKRPGRYQKRIDRLVAKTSTLEQSNATLLRELAKIRSAAPGDGANKISNAPSQAEIDALITKRSEELLVIREFNEKCNDVNNKGAKEFEDFGESVAALKEIGIMKEDFLSIIIELDAPEKVLYHLGQDVEEAEEIYNLPPAKRMKELLKLESKLSQIKEISKAPPPPNRVDTKTNETSSSYGSKYYKDMPMDEFVKWDAKYNKQKKY